jgi:TP901-1 family phage major tail protein
MALKGKNILIKADLTGGGSYTTIAALQSKTVSINSESVEVTNFDSDNYRELDPNGLGERSIAVSGVGIFTDDVSQLFIEEKAKSNSLVNLQIIMPNGSKYTGSFAVSGFEYTGEFNSQQVFSISFESADTTVFSSAIPNFYLLSSINASRINYSEGYVGNSNYPMAAEYREGDAFGTANIRVNPAINRSTMSGWWYWEWTVVREIDLLRLWLGLSSEANYPDQILGNRPNSASHGNDGFTTNCTQSRRYVESAFTQPWTAGYCYNQGDVVGMSYKTDTDELWTNVNGNTPIQVFQNIMGASNLIYITATFQDLNLTAGTGDKLRFNGGKDGFVHTPHAGSSALEGAY